jgi:hypothetical protein
VKYRALGILPKEDKIMGRLLCLLGFHKKVLIGYMQSGNRKFPVYKCGRPGCYIDGKRADMCMINDGSM